MADDYTADDVSVEDDWPSSEIDRFVSESPSLDRIVEVNQAVPAEAGGRVVVTSLELWTTLIVVHSWTLGFVPRTLRSTEECEEFLRRFEYCRLLRDDLGNNYGFVGADGGDFGKSTLLCQAMLFRGPVHPQASYLICRPVGAAEEQEITVKIG